MHHACRCVMCPALKLITLKSCKFSAKTNREREKESEKKTSSVDQFLDPHEKMRARDVSKVVTGQQAPRPSHEPGFIITSKTPPKPSVKVEDVGTAPFDWRFHTTNQTRHCYTRYFEYHRCIQQKGKDAEECKKFAKYYRSLCPSEWIEKWNEQRELGTFPGPF